VILVQKFLAGRDLDLTDYRDLYQAGLGSIVPDLARLLEEDPRLNELARKCIKGETVKVDQYENLTKLGEGGQAGVREIIISELSKLTVKIYDFSIKDKTKDPKSGYTVTQTLRADEINEESKKYANFEFTRFLLCQSPFVLKCYGIAPSEDGSHLLLLEHAANGDVEAYYNRTGQSTKSNGRG